MHISSAAEVGPPTYQDIEVLQETVLAVAQGPYCKVAESPEPFSLQLIAERVIAEVDELARLRGEIGVRPFAVCLLGKFATYCGGTKLLLRYKEMMLRPGMTHAGLAHDYIIQTKEDDVIEFGQSIRAIPDMPHAPLESPDILQSDQKLDEVEAGSKILARYTGNQLELSAGDCGVLFDRVHEYFL